VLLAAEELMELGTRWRRIRSEEASGLGCRSVVVIRLYLHALFCFYCFCTHRLECRLGRVPARASQTHGSDAHLVAQIVVATLIFR
jgi:hypothetical protein